MKLAAPPHAPLTPTPLFKGPWGPQPAATLIADSGADHSWIALQDAPRILDIELLPPAQQTRIEVANGQFLTATHSGRLPFGIPTEASTCYVVPGLSESLLSIPALTNAGLSVLFDRDGVTCLSPDGVPLLRGAISNLGGTRLYRIQWDQSTQSHCAFPAYQRHLTLESERDRQLFFYKTALNPVPSTYAHAVKMGWWAPPGITHANVLKHMPHSVASAQGHIHAMPPRSTKPAASAPVIAPADPASPADTFHCSVSGMSGKWYADETGPFWIPQSNGVARLLIVYHEASGYIKPYGVPAGRDIAVALATAHRDMTSLGHKGDWVMTDNATSEHARQYFAASKVSYNLTPVDIHRANKAERAIETLKDHFIAGMASVDPAFPLIHSAHCLFQVEVTLAMMRPCAYNPSISTYEAWWGRPWDWNAHPMGPIGTMVVKHVSPSARPSWGVRGIKCWYVGPATQHYRSWLLINQDTGQLVIGNTIQWFPKDFTVPGSSRIERLTAATTTLAFELQQARLDTKTDGLTFTSATEELQHLASIYAPTAAPASDSALPTSVPLTLTSTSASERFATFDDRSVQRSKPAPIDSTGRIRKERSPRHGQIGHRESATAPASLPQGAAHKSRRGRSAKTAAQSSQGADHARRPPAVQAPPTPPGASPNPTPPAPTKYQPNPSKRLRKALKKESEAAASSEPPGQAPHTPSTLSVPKGMQPRQFAAHLAAIAESKSDWTREHNRSISGAAPPGNPTGAAYGVKVLTTQGHQMTYEQSQQPQHVPLISDREGWEEANAIEWDKTIEKQQVVTFISPSDLPTDRCAFPLMQVLETSKTGQKRIRGTAGGHKDQRLFDQRSISSRASDLTTKKIFLNKIVSTGALHWTADLSDFYIQKMNRLHADHPGYMKIRFSQLPRRTIEKYNLEQYRSTGHILAKVTGALYGLADAGKIAGDNLVASLLSKGYYECESYEKHSIFRSTDAANQTEFLLNTDDFLISFHDKAKAAEVVQILRDCGYPVTVDKTGAKYCGMTIHHDLSKQELTISCPGYVEAIIQKHNLQHVHEQPSPAKYVHHQYGSHEQHVQHDHTPKLGPDRIKALEQIGGSLLWLALLVRPDIHPYISMVLCDRNKSVRTWQALLHIVGYLRRHPNRGIRYLPSDMFLVVHSDANFASKQSRTGGYHFLGRLDEPSFVNGPILTVSSLQAIASNCVGEAEYIATHNNGKVALGERNLLTAMGWPQPATPIYCDNLCAVGIANDDIKMKRMKYIDIKYHWVRDRVRLNHLAVLWLAGILNQLADLFTKIQPVQAHISGMEIITVATA